MALLSLLPYIDSRNTGPWSPLDMAHYVDQISAVFENPSIQQIPGGDSKAIWDTRTTCDFPNNVIDEMETYPRKKRKTPRSVKSMDPDSPTNDRTFEKLHKAVWTAAPSGLRRRAREPWRREKQQAEDLRFVGQLSTEVSDVPSLTDSSSIPSLPTLTVSTPTDANLDNLEPHILTSGYEDLESMDPVERLDSWMETLQTTSVESSMELEPPVTSSQEPARAVPDLGPPRRSNTMPVVGTPKKPKAVRQVRKRDSWPDAVVALRRPAFPRKKLQELQTTITKEEFSKSLTTAGAEKTARSKRMLSLLLPLVKPKEALQFFPLFTKREVKLLTEILEEDKKLAARLASVGVTLPLRREAILELAAAKKDADEESISSVSTEGSRASIEVTSIASSRLDKIDPFPEDKDLDIEINKRRETPSHLLPNSRATDKNWSRIVKNLDNRFRYITWCRGVWTLELESFNTMDIPLIPLYIANCPVILSYARPSPQISGQRPPDPLRDRPLPVGTLPNLSDEILSILFKTFPKASTVCVFLNQRMSVFYDHDFDHGIEHMTKPETFGGYRVSFMRNNQAFTATTTPSPSERLLTGKRVDVCRPGQKTGWTSCLGVRLRRRTPSASSSEPNDAITMTTHAFLTALRLPSPDHAKDDESLEFRSRPSNTSLSSSATNEDFAAMKVFDRTKKGVFGQYYHTYDDLHRLRGNVEASKFTHDLCLIKAVSDLPQEQLPVISFQRKKKNEFKRMEWCASNDMLQAKKGKMYLLNSWTGADSKNPKDGNVVAEGLVIGEAYQNIPTSQKEMYSRSILWRQNFTSKQWQVGQVQGLRERAYRVRNGAPVRRIRLEQHLVIQEHGYSGSPLAIKMNDKAGEESYAIFGFQNYAMRCWRGDDDDGFKKSAFGKAERGSVVNKVLMEALDHGAYEFFGSYQLPKKVMEDWDIVYDVEERTTEILEVKGKVSSISSDLSDLRDGSASESSSYIQRSSRKLGMGSRRRGREPTPRAGSKCVIV